LAKYYVPATSIATNTRRPFVRGLRIDDASLVVQNAFAGLQLDYIPEGVVVSEVSPNTPAATSLLKPGEIITHVNAKAVRSVREFYDQVRASIGPIELTVLNVQPGQPPARVLLN
jgi:S1-C subfamily serine protease